MIAALYPLFLLGLLLLPTDAPAQRRRFLPTGNAEIHAANSFVFCRVQYTSQSRRGRWGRGRGWGDWATDYPESDLNFSLRLSQLTTLDVARTPDGDFAHAIVRLDEPDLFRYPFIYMLEVGGMALTPEERRGLCTYLLRGGFLLVDDFWGDDAWENWKYEIEQVLPPAEYPMVDVPLEHELFHIVFDIKEVPQVPAVSYYQTWEMTGQSFEGYPGRYVRYGTGARCKGIFDRDGRLMVVVMHNTDLGDGWEREGENYGYFAEFSAKRAYPMGINIVVYAMTH